MKFISSTIATAILVLGASSCVQAAPKQKYDSSARGAKAILEQIDTLSLRISDIAFNLNRYLEERPSHELESVDLDRLAANVNAVNNDVRTLESERALLSEWETKTLDEILPLLHEVGEKAENAVETFNSSQSRLVATSFRSDTAGISKDAGEVATVVHEHLKLAKAQDTHPLN